jgi:DNA-3-methyladenine glycosylase
VVHRLPRPFYDRPVHDVARDLLGKVLVRHLGDEWLAGRIVETEAYARDDPASHSFRGPTARNRSMFGPPGHLYVYKIYSFHECCNVVTGPEGVGHAVLLRALEPLLGIPTMEQRRGINHLHLLCSGPARLCQALGITLQDDGTDLCGEEIFIADDGYVVREIAATPRIGISVATERHWRYVIPDSSFLSRRFRSQPLP